MTVASARKRFDAKVAQAGPDECWLWRGATHRGGYGHFKLNGRAVEAHRIAFFMASGAWPERHVLHTCDTPACCNPAHLRDGSHADNMRDCAAKRRSRSPRPGNGHRKLSDECLSAIRRRFARGETNKSALARTFGVTPTRIRQVVNT